MRKSERQEQILEMLKKEKDIKVTFLADYFKTSQITIRKDLNELYDKGKIHRVYGGASLVNTYEEPLQERRKKNSEDKDRIGKVAATLIKNGDSIFIDGGTTAESLSDHLEGFENITVITTGLNNVASLQHKSGVTVYVPEGRVDHVSYSIVGSQAEANLKKYHARLAFIGTDGFTLNQGFLNNSCEASAISRILIEQSQLSVILMDSSKFGSISAISLCDLNEVDYVITDSGIQDNYRQALEKAGVKVIIA